MPDIERLTRKLEAQRCSLADLCQLYRASSVLPRLEEALRCHEVCVCVGGGEIPPFRGGEKRPRFTAVPLWSFSCTLTMIGWISTL